MQASPIQLSICATCALLLLAKVREWWQSLGVAALPSASTVVPTPLPVVPQTTPPPAYEEDAGEIESFELASLAATTAAPSHPVAQASLPVAQAADPLPDPAPEAPAPAPLTELPPPVRPDFEARAAHHPRLAGPEPAQEASELQLQLADLATRELAAARLRARSVLLNAETQARSIVDEGERTAAAQIEKHLKAAPRPPTVELNAAHRQGIREAHAIGLRKGEIAALGRIEQVFHQIEELLSVDPRERLMVTSPSLSFEPGSPGDGRK